MCSVLFICWINKEWANNQCAPFGSRIIDSSGSHGEFTVLMVTGSVVSDPDGHVAEVTYAAWSVLCMGLSPHLHLFIRVQHPSCTGLSLSLSLSLYIATCSRRHSPVYCYYCNYAFSMFAWCYAGGDLDDLASFLSFRRVDPKFSVGWRDDSLIRTVTVPCPFCSINATTHSKFIPHLTRISYIMNSQLFRELRRLLQKDCNHFCVLWYNDRYCIF